MPNGTTVSRVRILLPLLLRPGPRHPHLCPLRHHTPQETEQQSLLRIRHSLHSPIHRSPHQVLPNHLDEPEFVGPPDPRQPDCLQADELHFGGHAQRGGFPDG